MKKSFHLILSVLLILLSKPTESISSPSTPVVIRVCILDDRENLYLVLKGAYKIYAIGTDRVLMEGPRLRANVSGTKGGLRVGKKDIKVDGIRVKVLKDSNIYIDGRRFRGDIDIIRKDNLKLFVVNHLPLEDYLYGVLYHEVSHHWPSEALKSQAIVARTFAIYQKMQSKLKPYDLRSDVYSQVYGGRTSERWATNRAVNLTKDKILVYNGVIFSTYYHATCAGYTEDASNLWNIDIPPLKGIECKFCSHSPHYRWLEEIPLWKLKGKLEENKYKIDEIEAVNILSKNKSGRIDKLEIKDTRGASVVLTAKDFRQMFGPNIIRSTKFDVSIKWNYLILKGYGWGHGVGMCQWGAFGMAKKGKKAEEILKFYYPGSEITTIDKLAEKP